MEVSLKSESSKINSNDLQIIEALKNDDDQKRQQKYQFIFFNKYKGYIYKGAIQLCVNFPDPEQLAIDITQQTFINAFRKIKDFDLSKEFNPEKHGLIIKAWLGKIANNCFKKEYAKRKNEVYIGDLQIIPEKEDCDLIESLYEDSQIEIPNEFRKRLNEAMNTLNEIQKHILLTYAGEGCLNSTLHLSDEALNYLCKMYSTSSANIRQIKKRALDKIKKHCF